jgi:hypothetical protein
MSYQRTGRFPRQSYYIPTYSRIRSPQHQWHVGAIVGTIVVLALITLVVYAIGSYEFGTEHLVRFTIAKMDDQATGSNGHQYLVFTKAGHVFADKDAMLHGKMNSSDIWAGLQVGHTYTCDVYGKRLHFLSSYPDIIWCAGVAGAPRTVSGPITQQ